MTNSPRRKPPHGSQGAPGTPGGGGPGKRRRSNKSKSDVWKSVPALPEPAPIVPVRDPAALLRSLGDPPLQGQNAVAQHYLVAVVERAAGLATALAAASGLLATPTDD